MYKIPRVLSVVALATLAAHAQTGPTFEVASIKPAAPQDLDKLRAAFQNGEMPRLGPRVSAGRAEYIYMTLVDLMVLAYHVKADQITGPDWIASERFDIFAKLPDGASNEDVPKMLQVLMEDRFKLTLHRGSKDSPALALVVAAGGLKIKEATDAAKPVDANAPLVPGEKQIDGPDGPMRVATGKDGSFTMNLGAKGSVDYRMDLATRSMKIEASQVTMGGLADMLTTLLRASGGSLQVADMTGLTGKYQVAIDFSLEDLRGAARSKWIDEQAAPGGGLGAVRPADAASDPGTASSLVGAIQSMGLKLVPRKVAIEQLIVDHAERTPAEN
jgi:uncharacterized protein (TIGR03435 family)